jgi:hypothetical protein
VHLTLQLNAGHFIRKSREKSIDEVISRTECRSLDTQTERAKTNHLPDKIPHIVTVAGHCYVQSFSYEQPVLGSHSLQHEYDTTC